MNDSGEETSYMGFDPVGEELTCMSKDLEQYLCLIAVFKNEAHIFREWLEHYTLEGVDHFFLLDNGSTDDYFHILENFPVSLIVDPTRHIQSSGMNKYFLEPVKEYEWVLICDLDEFVYARNGFVTISDYLKTRENNITGVNIPWKLFGSSGYNTLDKPQPELVVPNFIHRFKFTPMRAGRVRASKTITRTSALKTLHPHKSHVHNEKTWYIPIDDKHNPSLHLNHYRIQSLDWFMRVKATRGDVDWGGRDKMRTAAYFHRWDVNEVEDLELFHKRYTCL